MPTLAVYGIIALLILGSLSGIAYKIHDAGYQSAKAECERAAIAQRDEEAKQTHTAATKKEKEDAKAKVVYRTITKHVDREVEKPVYRNVCFEPNGVQLVNDALSGKQAATASKPDGAVRRVAPTK